MVRKRTIRIAAWLLIGILCAGSIPMTTKAEEPLHILALGRQYCPRIWSRR